MPETYAPPALIENTIVYEDRDGYWFYELNNKRVAHTLVFNKNTITKLKNHGFFTNLAKEVITQRKKKPSSLMLLLSKNCPMACRYCYATAGESNEVMSVEIADKAVSAFLSLKPKNPRITLFGGGEPTSNPQAIKHIVSKYKNKSRFNITTSGVMPRSFLDWLLANDVSITFSIDGPPEVQNFLRPLKNGFASSNIVESSLRYYKKKSNKPLSVRATLVEETATNIDSVLEYFDSIGVDRLHLEPLYDVGRALNPANKDILIQPNVDNWVRATVRALDWAKAKQKHLQVGELTSLLNPGTAHYCGAICGRAIVVTHNGLLTACSEVVDGSFKEWDLFCLGELRSEYLWNNNLTKLRKRTTKYMSVCLNCFLRYICRGGCTHRGWSKTGSVFLPDPRHCEFMKKIVPVLIKRMALRIQGGQPLRRTN